MSVVTLQSQGKDTNWFPLKPAYVHDKNVTTPQYTVIGSDGLSLVLDQTYNNPRDCTVNNYSVLSLTDQKRFHEVIDIETPFNKDVETFTTTLIVNDNQPRYIAIPEFELSDIPLLNQSRRRSRSNSGIVDLRTRHQFDQHRDTANAHDYFFEIHISGEALSVFHVTTKSSRDILLNLQPDKTGCLSFQRIASKQSSLAYKFRYLINRETSTLVLLTEDSSSIMTGDGDNNKLQLTSLHGVGSSESKFNSPKNIVRFQHNKTSTGKLDTAGLTNNWVVYKDKIDTNHVNISENSSTTDIQNNYLINSEYHNISDSSIPIGITPLKNQLTVTNNNTPNNVYRHSRAGIRDYTKIFSGGNQNKGSESITLGYDSYLNEITFTPGQLTYFHTAQDIHPFKKINVNDSGLISSGAIGGDTPLRADKIFKKRAGYRENTNHGKVSEEHSGKWLCAWLYKDVYTGNYAWVDRYYDPDKVSSGIALRIDPAAPLVTYTSQFENKNNAVSSSVAVYDKTSDLCFEPGSLYAYYRLGDIDISNIKSQMLDSAIQVDIRSINDITNPSINTDLPVNGALTFTDTVKDYAIGYIPKNRERKNSMTICTTLSSDNWDKPFGSVLIGNYMDKGMSLLNKRIISPIQLFRAGSKIIVYNNDFKLVNEIDIGTTHFKVAETEYYQTLAVFVEEDTSLVLYRYSTLSPYIVNKHVIDDTWTPGTIDNIDIKSTPDYVYMLTDSTNGTYTEIETVSLTVNTGLSAEYLGNLKELENDVGFDATNIIPIGDKVYIFDDLLTRVDGDGKIWFTSPDNADLFMYDPDIDVFTGQVRLTSNDTEVGLPMPTYFPGDDILDFKFDRYNMLWILYKYRGLYCCKKVDPNKREGDGTSILMHIDLEEALPPHAIDAMYVHEPDLGKVQYLTRDADGWLTLYGDRDREKTVRLFSVELNEIMSASVDQYKQIESIKGYERTGWLYSWTNGWLYPIFLDDRNSIYMDFTFDTDQDSVYFAGESFEPNNAIRKVLLYSDTHKRVMFASDYAKLPTSSMTKATIPANGVVTYTDGTTGTIFQGGVMPALEVHRKVQDVKVITDVIAAGQATKPIIRKYSLDTAEPTLLDTINLEENISISDLHKQDVSGLQFLLKSFYRQDKTNILTAKTRLTNPADRNDTVEMELSTDVSQYSPGAHEIVIVGDSENGAFSLYIDGRMRKQQRFDRMRFRFDEVLDKHVYIGTTPGVKGLPLYESIKTYKGLEINNITFLDTQIYNTALKHFEIENLHREKSGIESMSWAQPVGIRNYVDSVERMFKQRAPGRKSGYFDIDVNTISLSSVDVMTDITDSISSTINSKIPVNMIPVNYNWSKPLDPEDRDALMGQYDKYYYFKSCEDYPDITPTPEPTPEPTLEPTLPPTPTPTPTPTLGALPTPIPTGTPEPTATPGPTPTITGTPVPTPTPTATEAPTPTPTGTPMPTPTPTALPPDPCTGFPFTALMTTDNTQITVGEVTCTFADGGRICHNGATGGGPGSQCFVRAKGEVVGKIVPNGAMNLPLTFKYVSPSGEEFLGEFKQGLVEVNPI